MKKLVVILFLLVALVLSSSDVFAWRNPQNHPYNITILESDVTNSTPNLVNSVGASPSQNPFHCPYRSNRRIPLNRFSILIKETIKHEEWRFLHS